ncbi:MAG: hypothetical protein KIS92_10635 [Planctomycetota bacterium]|nr:hypothetical protein [Planctomycetota bacterium]
MRKQRRICAGLALPAMLLLAGCDGERTKTPPSAEQDHGTSTDREARMALRFSDETSGESLDKVRIDALLEALVPDALPYSSVRANGDTHVNVALFAENERSPSAQLIQKLGFEKARDEPDGSKLLSRAIKGAEKGAFIALLKEARENAARSALRIRDRLERAAQPGLLLNETRNAGGPWFLEARLVYTGQPLDLALPDAGEGGSEKFFLPIRVSADHEALNLKEGARAFARGGRVYLDANGALRVRAGTLDGDLLPVPAEARRVLIGADGRVTANLLDGTTKALGRLAVTKLARPQGDGEVFAAPADGSTEVMHLPGEAGVPALKPGHLEFPDLRASTATAELADQLRVMRLINGLEIALAGPARVDLPAGEVTPRPAEPASAEPRRLDIMTDLPLATAHLKALNIGVEALQGRTSIAVGARGDEQQRAVNALAKVLQGLLKRMAVCQENYAKANRTRDEQNRLNPYRRKTVRVGNEGEILVAEDASEFRKELKPESADAGPDGFVRYPNVNRPLEQADFERAAEEYRLVRTALERVAPNLIFPDPPALQVEPKAP